MLVQAVFAGMVLGFLSGFHCVGMCGPLALSLPVQHLPAWQKTGAHLLYSTGRIITYTVLGIVLGFAGRGFYLAGWQQWFSIAIGLFILVLTVLYTFFKRSYQPAWLKWFNRNVQKAIGYFLTQRNLPGYALLGMANGLLPCGMVYMAISAALVTGDVSAGALLMAGFGMGTVPAMFAIGIIGSRISLTARVRLRRLTPAVMIVMACLLILRGMNLGIPYISPVLEKHPKEAVSCH